MYAEIVCRAAVFEPSPLLPARVFRVFRPGKAAFPAGAGPGGWPGLSARPNRYFLDLRIYRRTFLVYLLIVMLLITGVFAALIVVSRGMGLRFFSSEANSSYMLLEQQLTHVSSSIDSLFVRLYATPSLREDFMQFFISTPSEYTAYRLERGGSEDSFLDECSALVSETDFCITHILYDSGERIADMEYSREGYSRWRSVSAQEAEGFTKGRLTVVRDVESAGSVTFVIDPAGLVYGYYCAGGTAAAALEVGGVLTVVGDTLWQQDVDWDGLVRSGAPEPGFPRAGGGVFCSAHSSSLFGYTLVSAAPWGEYMTTPLRAALIIGLAVAAGFAVVTIFYARKFSKDSVFIQGILQSMSRAESSDFTPVAVGDRRDEYAMIAQHLNSLYEHLQTLIEQRYVLTISQQRAEIQRLSAQLNPHFLYNTLESIRLRALKEGDAHLAEATGSLGSLYRSIVKTAPVITIGEELEIAKKYLDLMCFLDEDGFIYHTDVPEGALGLPTPKIWMQPIIENFFKHDFHGTDELKVVVISGTELDSDEAAGRGPGWDLEFMSNLGHIGSGELAELNAAFAGAAEEPEGGGIGLRSVWYRLRLFYGGRVDMRMENCEPSGVALHISIYGEVTGKDVPPADS